MYIIQLLLFAEVNMQLYGLGNHIIEGREAQFKLQYVGL